MKTLLPAIFFLTLAIILPHPLRAEVNINIMLAPPEPVYFERPPEVIVLPDTNNVYVVPDRDFDMFFWNGYWWRPWEGRWYRSRSYNRGWSYYNNVPSFYYDVEPGWRDSYRDRNWTGHRWNYERIPHQRLQNNWKQWHDNQYWQRNKTWGVERYQPRSKRQVEEIRAQRQEHYRQRPEVQRHQQHIQEQKKQPRSQGQQQINNQKRPPQARKHPEQQAPPHEESQNRNRPNQGESHRQRSQDE